MKSGGGKAKGSAFEREVCKKLTIWVTGQEKPYVFWRSPSSGSVATIAQSSNISGDIISVKEDGNFFTDVFSIECKDGYPDAEIMKIFKNNKNDIIQEFWKQCITDARKANKQGMLIFKKKGFPIIVGIEDGTKISKVMKDKISKNVTISYDILPHIVFFEFDEFLNSLDKKIIRRKNK